MHVKKKSPIKELKIATKKYDRNVERERERDEEDHEKLCHGGGDEKRGRGRRGGREARDDGSARRRSGARASRAVRRVRCARDASSDEKRGDEIRCLVGAFDRVPGRRVVRGASWTRRVTGGERTREAGGVCAWDTRAEESDRDCGEEVL